MTACALRQARLLFGVSKPIDSYSTLAVAFYTARRIDFASGLGRLFHLGKSGAVTRLAFSFC